MFVERPSRQEKLLKYALVALGLTLILVLLLAVSEMSRVAPFPASERMKPPITQAEDETKKAPIEELTGVVVAVDMENSYIRVLSDKDGKIYSIAIPSSDGTTGSATATSMDTLAPSDKVSLRVEGLSDTEQTDFSAVSLAVVGQKEFPRVNSEVGAE